ncbi:24013_t:CDS:2, partial [Gigaspora rosea]
SFNIFEVGISENTYEFGNAEILFDAESGNTDDLFESVTFNTFKTDNPETYFEQANNERDGRVIEYTENLSNLSSNEFISFPDINNTYENQGYDKKESELKYPIELEMSFKN